MAALISAAPANAEEAKLFSVPAQPLEAALAAFAAQANISMAAPVAAPGVVSHPINGRYEIATALRRLLAGTGYAFDRLDAKTFRVAAIYIAPIPSSSDVIVTSSKRPTALGDLPRAVDRLSLKDVGAGAVDGRNLAARIGGLAYTNTGRGRDKLILRGVSDGALAGRAQATVGIYLDDMRLTYAAPDPDLLLADVATVEVLKGPQGALYGGGSIGGVMQIETNPVNLNAFEGHLSLTGEAIAKGGSGGNAELVANAPLIKDRLGLRAVVYDQTAPGWLDNTRLGLRDTNDTNRKGARITLSARLSDSLSADAFVVSQAIDAADSQYLRTTPLGLVRDANFLEPHDNDFSAYGVRTKGAFSWANLSSTTAYVRHQLNSRYDATSSFASLGLGLGKPAALDTRDTLSILLNETRLAALPGAKTPWMIGVFSADGDNRRQVAIAGAAAGSANTYREDRVDGIDEKALFGSVSFPLGKRISLSAGARLFYATTSTRSDIKSTVTAASDTFSGHLKSSGFAPDVRLSFRPSRHRLFWLSATEGYRGPGFNTDGIGSGRFSGPQQPFRTYRGDELWSYEAGGRLDALNDKLNLEFAAFWNDWRSIQTDQLIAGNFAFTGNAGRGRVVGLEAAADYFVTSDIDLRAHFLFNEPELSRVDPSYSAKPDAALPGASHFSGGVAITWRRQTSLAGGQLALFSETQLNYFGKANIGFSSGPGISIAGRYETNARLGAQIGKWSGEFYARNMFDESGLTFSLGNPYASDPSALVTTVPPRSFGVTLRRDF